MKDDYNVTHKKMVKHEKTENAKQVLDNFFLEFKRKSTDNNNVNSINNNLK